MRGIPLGRLFCCVEGLEELLAILSEVGEGEEGGEGELESGAGDEVMGREGEEGGAGLLGEIAETIPRGGGNGAEFGEGGELEVEGEKGKVAIAEKKVGAAEGLLGGVTPEPEETRAGLDTVGARVEGVGSVDEGEGDVGRGEGG
jgi:hypothetical protein